MGIIYIAKSFRFIFLLSLLVMVLAGCGDDGDGGGGTSESHTIIGASGEPVDLNGTWIICFFSFEIIIIYSESNTWTSVINIYETIECSDTATEFGSDTGTYTLGGTTNASLGDGTVTATKQDFSSSVGVLVKSILYVNDTVTPNAMFTGDTDGELDSDGYPTELGTLPLLRQ